MARVPVDHATHDIRRRMRNVLVVKAVVAAAFFGVVLATLPHPVSIAVSALDLALVPAFYALARRRPELAVYGLVAETALGLIPRQFVQGYVNGVNWPIYIVLPLIAGYVMATPRALHIGLAITLAIGVPAMMAAALTLPPGMRQADVLTAVIFVIGLAVAAAVVIADLLKPHP